MSKTQSPITFAAVRRCQVAAWSLSLLVCLQAIIFWGHDYHWQLVPVNNYVLFPLLGLLAFSLMWAHYMAGALRQWLQLDKTILRSYFETTSAAVLVLICLHPSLLIYQRFRDGAGLPPGSYESYVAPGMGWITLLGTVSLVVFLAFEFRRFYGQRRWWHFVEEAGDAAMLAIVYHGLRLGHQLHGWFLGVWWFYAVSLVVILIHKYYARYFRAAVST